MHARLPRHLIYRGRQINLAGKGSRRGAFRFIDPLAGETFELFFARIVQTGPHFFLTECETGRPLVRVDNHLLSGAAPAAVGQIVVVGPVYAHAQGPRAAAAWCAEIVSAQPRAVRRRGVVAQVAWGGRSGQILAEGGGYVFVSRTQLCPGLALAPGACVSFVQKDNGHGPTAYDVRPA
jgi:hypothetical protein